MGCLISTREMIEREKDVLNQYAIDKGGAKLAEFVAKRTRQYIVQEISKSLNNCGYKDAAKHVDGFLYDCT